jgi:2-dehydro-3-deoxyphosphogluconate aldolase/(4S)-4-hydroxy-2-oxoglutarate aldolase
VGYLPGVFTGAEVGALLDRGHTWLKLFPAGPAGPSYLRALRGPYPRAAFMASGGIGLDEAPRFLEAGARFVGMTTALVPSHLDADGAWRQEMSRALERLLA